MRVLMLSDVYFPRVNGVSTSIQTFRDDLHRLGVVTTLIAPDYPQAVAAADTIRIPSRYLFFDPEDRMMRRRSIAALTDELRGQYDLVHIQTPFVAHTQGVKLARRLGLPVVESYHTYFEEYFHHYLPILPRRWLGKLAGLLSRIQCNQVDAVIVPTPMIRDVLERYGVRRPLHVLPTGLNLESLQGGDGARFREACNIPADRPVLLHVGRVALEKNIAFLIDVLGQVRRQVPDVLLVIAGEGPALAKHRADVAAAGLTGHVHFVGYLNRQRELLDCYAAANVFCFASRTETQGLVLLEAMAVGLPVVSTAVLGTREVLKHAGGAVVVPEDRAIFAAAIIELLNSPSRQHQLGLEGRRYAAGWTGELMARRLLELYAGLAPAGATSPVLSGA